jgi:hypothetical protein
MLKVQEEEWEKNGCSIMMDAWTDQKRRGIMNLCLHCSVGTSFLESREASDESHTGHLIFEYVDHFVCLIVISSHRWPFFMETF